MPGIVTVSGFLIRILLAVVLGIVLGLERQLTNHVTGIRTNVIVCVGSFAFTAFSYLCFTDGVDLTRVASGIVSGIGFLGAGVILSDGTKVKGLTTAASIWASSAVGILCCLDNILYAIIVAATLVFCHLILHPVSEFINKQQKYDKEKRKNEEAFYKISIICEEERADEIKTHIVQYIRNLDNILLRNLSMRGTEGGNKKITAEVSTRTKDNELIERVITHVGKQENIISTGWENR